MRAVMNGCSFYAQNSLLQKMNAQWSSGAYSLALLKDWKAPRVLQATLKRNWFLESDSKWFENYETADHGLFCESYLCGLCKRQIRYLGLNELMETPGLNKSWISTKWYDWNAVIMFSFPIASRLVDQFLWQTFHHCFLFRFFSFWLLFLHMLLFSMIRSVRENDEEEELDFLMHRSYKFGKELH